MFPHHENEIAQSESVTHKPFARHWMHVRFLLVDGRKMSKSEGNFYTLRDLLLKGYKASAIRLALISVPYRHQLNFTFDGLIEATNAIERLRTFHQRLTQGSFAPGENPALQQAAEKAQAEYMAALSNDLKPLKPARPSLSWFARRIRRSTRGNFLPLTGMRFWPYWPASTRSLSDRGSRRRAHPPRPGMGREGRPRGRCGSRTAGPPMIDR